MKTLPLILANSAAPAEYLHLGNEYSVDAEGWALIAPYGEHALTRLARNGDGQVKEEKYLQVVDEGVVDALVNDTFGQKLRRALFGLPIYRGHPDLAKLSPATVTVGNQAATPVGSFDKLRKTDRGCEIRVTLMEDGATAVQQDGCKFLSGLWPVRATGEVRNGAMVVKPMRLLSAGLTPTPNISGVDSLANAGGAPANANQNDTTMKQLLIGWLAAQGTFLANEANDAAVLEGVQKLLQGKTGEVTTLGNEKSTLTGQLTTLTTERDTLKGKVTTAETALANERTNHTTALANERKGRAEATVDLAITQLRLAPTEREAKITLLANATDFPAVAKPLLEAAPNPKFRTAAKTTGDAKDGAANQRTAREQVAVLENSDAYKGIANYAERFNAILKDHPALAEELNRKPGT